MGMIMSMMGKAFVAEATPWSVIIAQATNTHGTSVYFYTSPAMQQRIQMNYSWTFTVNFSQSQSVWGSPIYPWYYYSYIKKNWSIIWTQFYFTTWTWDIPVVPQNLSFVSWDIIELWFWWGSWGWLRFGTATLWNLTISAAVANPWGATILVN